MYRSGLYYGLQENSYIDERMDPDLATDAACRYLKKLHDIYGDWNLALASYNAGPGNVNKAIRRSGGKKTYWEVRPFLPAETQGYVPNFIAAAYLLTYHAEHNIVPMEAKWNYAQLDTICLKGGIHMSTISQLTGWELDEIQMLNPIYKTSYIPSTTPRQCISGPLLEIGKLVSLESELYQLEKTTFSPPPIVIPALEEDSLKASEKLVPETEKIITNKPKPAPPVIVLVDHVVKRGEGLGIIAAKYAVTVSEIMTTNNMKSTSLFAGQKLKIPQVVSPSDGPIGVEIVAPVKEKATTTPTPKVKAKPVVPAKKYYNVKGGDTGTKISQKHNLTQQQLSKLNPGVNLDRITVGQQLRVK
jgi:membrane-bound lytic murein transglycosylase D